MKNYLEFEKEIKTLEQEVDGLKSPFGSEGISEVDTQKIKNTQNEINEKLKETYANLNSWQRTQVARHEDRPKANFYIKKIFSQFTLLSGDRYFGDDKSVTTGFGLIENKSVLEAILHPKVIVREQEKYLSISTSNPSAIVIVDAALLIESGNYKNVDKVIVVQSREEQQIQRILSRGFQSYDQAIARIKNQMSFEEKSKYADYILDNQSQAEDLRQKVQEIYAKLLNSQ